MKVKEAFDQLFHDKNIKFDKSLYKKILINNIEFITKNDDFKNLFGSQLIGCHLVKYTYTDRDNFFNSLFNMDAEFVEKHTKQINTINKNFKIATDVINLTCFYIAHRFLSNTDLKEEDRIEYAKEIFNYFNYRTLVIIISNYFIYPISEDQSLTLFEKLSNRYIIKKLKNWNEYCKYRSDEYLKSKYLKLIVKLNDDVELPNAINDLFIRTKDTLKNIYSDFIDMNENDTIIGSKRNVITDLEGKEVIVDKINTPESYFIYLESILVDKKAFIKDTYISVVIDILKNLSYKQLDEALTYMFDFMYKDKTNYNLINNYFKDILINTIDYLQKNDHALHKNSNAIQIINLLIGNVLYARGDDLSINKVKEDGIKIINNVYKTMKHKHLSDKISNNIRNGIYIYIVLRTIIEN